MKLLRRVSPTRIIALSFILIIVIGTGLLSLPAATKMGHETTILDALFTATSSTCVTGMTVYDTFTHWTMFGQIVILVLCQIGGLGFMSFMTMAAIFMNKKIGLQERLLLVQSSGNIGLSGVVKLIKGIFLGTFLFESLGAVVLTIAFSKEMSISTSIYYGIFHSIMSFCNAGGDLMGVHQPYSSLTFYAANPVVCITVMLLTIVGGVGFFVWSDVVKNKWHFNRYSLHSKIVLYSTAILLMAGWFLYYMFEGQGVLYALDYPDKIFTSLFMSVSSRTSGFSIVDYSQLSEPGILLTMCLMFIGGGAGSTAGGIKITTIAILFVMMVSYTKGNKEVVIFKKKIDDTLLRQASAIFFVYLLAVIIGTVILCVSDGISLENSMFEVIAAISTTGFSVVGTHTLSEVARVLLLILMFGGRIGFMSLIMVFSEKKEKEKIDRPVEKIMIG